MRVPRRCAILCVPAKQPSRMLRHGGSEHKRMPRFWARVASAARAAYLKPANRRSACHVARWLPHVRQRRVTSRARDRYPTSFEAPPNALENFFGELRIAHGPSENQTAEHRSCLKDGFLPVAATCSEYFL